MSSHSVALSKALKQFKQVQELHKENIRNEYSRGLYNGLELAMALMTNKEPKYVEKIKVNSRKHTIENKGEQNEQ